MENEIKKKKNHKIIPKQNSRCLVFFLSRLEGFEITCTSSRKMHSKPLFKKKMIFAFFNQKIVSDRKLFQSTT